MSVRTSAALPALIMTMLAIAISDGLAQGLTDEEEIAIGIIFLVLLGIFLIPTMVAFIRGHPNRWPILLINIVFGFTILGWFGALIWAASAVHRSSAGSHGGESGLNIFTNDSPPMRVASQPQLESDTADIGQKLLRLKQLREEEAISGEEYERLRAPLIQRLS